MAPREILFKLATTVVLTHTSQHCFSEKGCTINHTIVGIEIWQEVAII